MQLADIDDDGAGLDGPALLTRARALGVDIADPQAACLHPGVSTRPAGGAISGRGVGLDVVADRVQRLGGTIGIDSVRGTGTRVELRLPLAGVSPAAAAGDVRAA